ncbi:MAG: formyltransferase family protein [Pedobacter sp.]|uniref:methionyl-tRNA formyltransferase n=1 Tax=Pedobacter sp. TaxID=1411316 RepID=UPI003568C0A0
MKILIFTNSSLFVKIVSELVKHAQLVGIVIPEMENHDLFSTIEYADNQSVPLLKVSDADLQETDKVDSFILNTGCSVSLVMTFPFKLPERILNISGKGMFNVHFSKLPSYKGADPLFWQLKNGLKEVSLSIHKMTSEFDEGPISFSKELLLFPGENYGLVKTRLALLMLNNLREILQNILTGKYIAVTSSVRNSYYKRPRVEDLTINWEKQSAQEIENLVNAANPIYNGAITYLQGQQIQVLEVSGVDGAFEPGTILPGTIFHIDQYHGPMVYTADRQLLLLNVVATENGVFSGKKLCAMGLKQGDVFKNLN